MGAQSGITRHPFLKSKFLSWGITCQCCVVLKELRKGIVMKSQIWKVENREHIYQEGRLRLRVLHK
jgi:hypothetical protein